MKEIRDGAQSNRTPLVLDVDDFKGDFSFDDLFGNLVTEVLPSCLEKEVDSLEGHGNIDGISNGHMRAPSMSNAGKLLSSPLFPEVDALLSLFKNSSSQLVEQKRQVDAKLSNLTKEVSVQDLKHRKTFAEQLLLKKKNYITLTMKEIRDGAQSNRTPLVLDVDDFKGDFSFDDLFGNVVTEVLPSCLEKEVDSLEGHGNIDGISNGHMRAPSMSNAGKLLSSPLFPEVDALLSLFKNSSSQLVEQKRQVDAKLSNLTKEVSVQDLKHRKTLAELEKGVDGLFGSFARLDSRISSVGHTAAKIGDHLQSADTQRESASQTIELIKYLMEFNRSAADLTQLSPLFIDDNRVAEAASIAQKLRSFADEDIGRQKTTVSSAVGNATSNKGLEVAITNLQEYCNALENRLLARFDTATQKRDLSTMGEYGKILSQFNRGTSAMQHYVGLRPMFDVEVMNADAKLVLGDEGAQPSPSNVAHGLSSMFKEIADTVRKEAATIAAVFPSPKDVMSILVQRVLEDRVPKLLEKLLLKPSLVNPPPMAEGGLVLYLRLLAVAYEKTQEFDKELRSVGCGDLDVEGLTESLFLPHKDIYIECEQASLKQLYKAKMDELRSECQLSSSESSGTIGRSKGASIVLSNPEISVTVVTEFVRWNEEAISRCSLFSLQPAALAASIKPVFTCLLDQVSQYIIGGLERSREGITEAAALREKHLLGTSVSRRVAAAAASAAENAAAAGESSFKSFMASVQRCGSSVAILQQYFVNSISRRLLPVDGAHAASSEEMATAMSRAESVACKGLQQCIETVMAEVERLLSTEQKATDYRSPDDGIIPDHRPTSACACAVAYLSRVLESAFTGLEGLNKQAFLTELGNRLHKGLLNHWQKFTFNPSGGLRLKRDITEYGEFVRSFNAPPVDEKFEQLGIIANVFIVAPESLGPLFEGTPSIKKDAQRFIQLRDDYKNAKLASKLSSLWS